MGAVVLLVVVVMENEMVVVNEGAAVARLCDAGPLMPQRQTSRAQAELNSECRGEGWLNACSTDVTGGSLVGSATGRRRRTVECGVWS